MTDQTLSLSFQGFSIFYEILVRLGIIKERKPTKEEQEEFKKFLEAKVFHFEEAEA